MGPLIFINSAIYIIAGPAFMGQVLIVTCTLPSLIFFYLLSKHRDGRFLFTLCLVDTISYEIIAITSLLDHYLFGNQYIFMFISRLVIFPILEQFIRKYLRSYYFTIQRTVNRGWISFAIISALFFMLEVYLASIPTLVFERPKDIPPLIFVLILIPFVYYHIYIVLSQQHKLFESNHREQLLQLQAANLANSLSQTNENNERIRIERHNMRHRLQTVASMIQKEEYVGALEFLTASEKQLDETVQKRWCENPVLDAVFSSYFNQAERFGIRINAQIAFNDEIQPEISEVAIVFANALENAINACKTLEEHKRIIRVRCISHPQHMFSISNPYKGKILVDEIGRPISLNDDHGLGTKSIIAFCEKHDAYYEYKTDNNWFTLRIVLK